MEEKILKKVFMTLILLGTLALSACGGAAADKDHAAGTDVEVHDVWARAALKDGNGAAYMLMHNHSTEEDALVGASSDVATAVEIHLSQITANGTMEMVRQESVALPADGEVEFKPGSYHVMLVGLKQDLKAGDEIKLTLHFKNHEDITLTVPVLETGDMGGSGMDGHMP
jgi:copper(I)-binding protein